MIGLAIFVEQLGRIIGLSPQSVAIFQASIMFLGILLIKRLRKPQALYEFSLIGFGIVSLLSFFIGLLRGYPLVYVIGDTYQYLIGILVYFSGVTRSSEFNYVVWSLWLSVIVDYILYINSLLDGAPSRITNAHAVLLLGIYVLMGPVKRLRWVVPLMLLLVDITLSLTRAYWFGAIIIISMSMLIKRKNAFYYLCPLVLIILFGGFQIAQSRIADIMAGVALAGRLIEAQSALRTPRNSFFGAGMGAVFDNARKFIEPDLANDHFIHISQVDIYFRTGLLGLALISYFAIAFTLHMLVRWLRCRAAEQYAAAVINITFWIMSLGAHYYLGNIVLFFMLAQLKLMGERYGANRSNFYAALYERARAL